VTDRARVLGEPSFLDLGVTALTGPVLFLPVVAAHTTVVGAHVMHRPLERHAVGLLVPLERVALDASADGCVMTSPAGFLEVLVVYVRKGNGVHLRFIEIGFGGMEQDEVGLTPFETLGVRDSDDLPLSLGRMTS
jgi:hypothetical protein